MSDNQFLNMLAEIYSIQQAINDLKEGKIESVIAQLEFWVSIRKKAISLIEDQE